MGHAFHALSGEWVAGSSNADADWTRTRHLSERRTNPAGSTDGQGCANTRHRKLKIMNISFCLKFCSRTWIGSVQGGLATWSTMGIKIVTLDQVATAPCTDPIQA